MDRLLILRLKLRVVYCHEADANSSSSSVSDSEELEREKYLTPNYFQPLEKFEMACEAFVRCECFHFMLPSSG